MDELNFFEYLEFYFKVKSLDNQSCLVFPGFFNRFFDTVQNTLRTDQQSIYLDDFSFDFIFYKFKHFLMSR